MNLVLKKIELRDFEQVWQTDLVPEFYFQTPLFCKYYQNYFGPEYNFELYGLFDEANKLRALLPLTFNVDTKEVSYFGHELDFIFSKGHGPGLDSRNVFNNFLKDYKKEKNCLIIIAASGQNLTDFYNLESKIKHEVFSFVDLELGEDEIYRSVRKSYRSLINWGKRELSLDILDKNNPDEQKFYQFHQFHIDVAGRETRSKLTWDIQLDMIKRGEAFITLNYYGDRLVAGTLNFMSLSECYYGVGVNDRQLMAENKPIGHWNIMKSILVAKEKGMKKFNLGPIGPEEKFQNDKEKNIAIFKSGFASQKTIQNKLIF